MKHQLLKDLILERYKSIGQFYRENKKHRLMPSRDRLYRMLNKDIRENEFKDIFAILALLGLKKEIPVVLSEVAKGEEDFYELNKPKFTRNKI
jgi:hypothetical protein